VKEGRSVGHQRTEDRDGQHWTKHGPEGQRWVMSDEGERSKTALHTALTAPDAQVRDKLAARQMNSEDYR
jgi:hypothetical protein